MLRIAENYTYIRAGREHIVQISDIERLSFDDPWSYDSFAKEFEDGLARYFAAIGADGAVAGYCGYWSVAGEAHITNIAVHPDHRGRGVGAGMITLMLSDIAETGHTAATLEVRVDNHTAIRLYEKFGFERAGIRKKYYERGKKDALIMWKKPG